MKVKCSSCGAEFEIDSGLKITKCPYCKSSIFITKESGTLERLYQLSLMIMQRKYLKKKV